MVYTILNGLENDVEYNAVQENIKAVLKEKGYLKEPYTNWIDLYNQEIKSCVGCDYCVEVNPGMCALKDGQHAILKQFMSSDIVLLLTSIQFGCCNAQTKNFMDRSEPLFLPYQIRSGKGSIMKGRYDKYPEVIVAGIGDVTEEECFCKFFVNSNLLQVCKDSTVSVFSKNTNALEWRRFLDAE